MKRPWTIYAAPLALWAISAACVPASLFAQAPAGPVSQPQAPAQTSAPQAGTIVGTVTDINDTPLQGATVALQATDQTDIRTVTTNESGFFEIHDVAPGSPYHVKISAVGFAEWESPDVTLEPGQYKIEDAPELRIEEVATIVTVTPESSEEIAIEQVKTEEKQRALGGIFPDFYAVYNSTPAPLDARLRFSLALRLARDPFTFAGVAMIAGVGQALNYPKYRQGLKGYSERFGASYANSLADTMIGGALLPSLLHQDPRYYYDGKGSIPSRTAHALASILVARGEDGHLEPNYSSFGGDFAAAAVSNLYYPRSSRGMGIVLDGFATNMAIHSAVRLLDEFVFHPQRASSDRSAWNNRSDCLAAPNAASRPAINAAPFAP
jgi:hypothetical protein